ncbi:MAG: DUF3971 domain-containing protein [Rhodovarius sp.]|nr:DUF3971 domain-containing protein [Rhodovarius sp.]
MLLSALGAGALAWRLAQGPIELAFLGQRLARGLSVGEGGVLRAEGVALAWAGFREGGAALPALHLSGLHLSAPGVEAEASSALLHLSLRALLRGHLALSRADIAAARLRLDLPRLEVAAGGAAGAGPRQPLSAWLAAPEETGRLLALRGLALRDGELRVALGPGLPELVIDGIGLEAARGRSGGLSAQGRAVLRLGEEAIPFAIAGLGGPEGAGQQPIGLSLSASGLWPARLAGLAPQLAPLALLDAPLSAHLALELDRGLRPQAARLALDAGAGLLRVDEATVLALAGASVELSATREELLLERGEIRLAPQEGPGGDPRPLPLAVRGRLLPAAGGWSGELSLGLRGVDLSRLARFWPHGLAPELRAQLLARLAGGSLAEAALTLGWSIGAEGLRIGAAELSADLRDLYIAEGEGLALRRLRLEASLLPGLARLSRAEIELAGGEGGLLLLSGEARRSPAGWAGRVEAQLDRLALADLPRHWPEALAPGARGWITRFVTAGELREGRWRAELAEDGAGGWALLALSGEARVERATVHWLAPIPPLTGLQGRLRFGREAILIEAEGGRQSRPDGQPGQLQVATASLSFLGLDQPQQRTEMQLELRGPLTETMEVLRHPRLRLFERRPLEIQVLEGQAVTRLSIAFPLLADLNGEMIALRAESRVQNLRLGRLLFGRDLERAALDLTVDTERLRAQGSGVLAGAELRFGLEMDLRSGGPAQVLARERIEARAGAQQIAALGLDLGDLLQGPLALTVETERRRNGQARLQLRADLTTATIALAPARWVKPAGQPAQAEAVIRLQGEALVAIEAARLDARELALRGRAEAEGGRIRRIELTESVFGASRFQGDIRPPDQAGGSWQVLLRGPTLDVRPVWGGPAPAPPAARNGTVAPHLPPLIVEARFDRVILGERREVFGIQARGVLDGQGVLRQAGLRGRTGPDRGAFELTIAPQGEGRSLRLSAEDGGALIHAFDGLSAIDGGRLSVQGSWAGHAPGLPLAGVAELEGFAVRGAPAIGKLLQAMTLYGLVDALQGGQGLAFTRLTAPFTLTAEELTLNDWRAFSPSLGITARGRILRRSQRLEIEGTIVPAYLINQLLGNLPLIGRLFSPEPGGGVFATAFRVQGPAEDPQVSINPLSTVTPGFLRGLFGLGQEAPGGRR